MGWVLRHGSSEPVFADVGPPYKGAHDVTDRRARLLWRLRALVRPPITLGVRLCVVDALERVVLVRHTYTGGWHFPGGGVDPGETAAEASLREFGEETGLAVAGEPELFGIYFNRAHMQRDHVAFFVVRDAAPFEAETIRPQATEIAEAIIAPLAALPDGTTGATRRRLAELAAKAPPSAIW